MFTLRPPGRVAFAAALTLAAFAAGTSVASAADRSVANSGSDDGDCVTASCATLEYAQQQVQAGDTLRLAAGVYPLGDATFNVDDVTYERTGPGEATITLPGDSYGIQVGGNDVTFRGLTVSTSDGTIQGDTWAFTYTGSALTLDRMLVEHMNQGVMGNLGDGGGGDGITVTNSTFSDITFTDVSVVRGHVTATDNDFTGDGGLYVSAQATVTATGNVFRGNTAGDGGHGIYVDGGSEGGTVSGNRFSPNLEYGINYGQTIQAPNNWWGCNAGIEHRGCVGNYDLPPENAEPHLVLNVTADPNPFVIAGSSTITTSLTSSDPESPFVGGPVGTDVRLVTSKGTLDDALLRLVSGTAQTTLRQTVDGSPVVTAFLDHASAIASLGLVVPGPATREIASTGSDDGDCISSPCATLSYTQDRVQAGDTVRLAAGVYPIGDATFDVDDVTYEHSGAGEAKVTLPEDSHGFQVGGQGITFRKLTVTSTDDTIQGYSWAFAYHGSDLTLDTMRVEHTAEGVVGTFNADDAYAGTGITVRNSTFTDITGTAIGVDRGHTTATDNDISSGSGIFVTDRATVTATGNVFRGSSSGGGNGIYVEGNSLGGTVSGNRFSPSLEVGIHYGQEINAANNWWGCNAGIEHDGCVDNYDLPPENAEPHLVLDLTADPNPFLTTGFSTLTARLISSNPESSFVGGPVGTEVALATSEGELDDTQLNLVDGVGQTVLRQGAAGVATVTATLDNASSSTTVEARTPQIAQTITFTSTLPTSALVGGDYEPAATGGESGNPVIFSVDESSTTGACTIDDTTVFFTGVGSCTLNANQAGDANYTAAAQKQQTVSVAPAPVTSASLSPSSFAYDAVDTGADAAPQSQKFTFTNTGNRAIAAQAPTLTNRVDYAVTADTCTDAEIAPAETCSVAVSFTPATVGITSGTLRVGYNAGSDAVEAELTGTGLAKKETVRIIPNDPGTVPVPPADPAPPTVLPLELSKVRTPARCLVYGAATPKKTIAFKTNAKATVSWTIKKARGGKALLKCPPAPSVRKYAKTSGKAKGSGAVKTNATGSATVKLSTLLPAKVRRAMKPGLYRVLFVARSATGVSTERVILIRVLKQR